MSVKFGDVSSLKRNFTKKDVEWFTEVSGDEGIHYLTLDEQRRLVVQGLLTATLPTKIGGDHNVLVRTMTFEFLRPVFTDDTILYDVKIEQYKKQENYRTAIKASFRGRKGNAVRGFAGIVLSS